MRYFLSLALLLSIAACDSTGADDVNEGEPAAFSVHLQTHYSNTPVQIELDGETVFDDTVSTNYVLSLATFFPVDIKQGEHRLHATVNGRIEASKTFTVGDTLNVAVNYDPDREQIVFSSREEPYLYY